MATPTESKLKSVYTRFPPGTPLTAEDLAALDVSADLAVHYVRSGWLKRLARGVYSRPGEPLTLYASLLTLERKIEGLHVGGRTALDWHGVRQYVSQRETLQLYGWKATHLPEWFVNEFPAEYHRKRLFRETPRTLLHVAPLEGRSGNPQVSEPERAVLELLSEVGVRQPIEETRELMESTYNLRADVLSKLLTNCTSVKTVRLCLQLGADLSLPWRAKLNPAKLPTGSNRPWVARRGDRLWVLKPQ